MVAFISCCVDLHSDAFFGLTMDDRADMFGESKKNFKKPSVSEIAKNKAHIEKLKRKRLLEEIAAEGSD